VSRGCPSSTALHVNITTGTALLFNLYVYDNIAVYNRRSVASRSGARWSRQRLRLLCTMYANIPRALDHLRSRQFYDRNYTQLTEPLIRPLLYALPPGTHLAHKTTLSSIRTARRYYVREGRMVPTHRRCVPVIHNIRYIYIYSPPFDGNNNTILIIIILIIIFTDMQTPRRIFIKI